MHPHTRLGVGLRILFAFGVVSGCAKPDSPVKASPASAAVAKADTGQVVRATSLLDVTGPRLVIDSSIPEPRLELRNNEFVISIPSAMAKVLADSLPGFTPVQRAALDKGLVRWVAGRPDREPPSLTADSDAVFASALSVVVGDFNGDGKRDVAMDGIAGDSAAGFFLLAATDSRKSPQLIYMYRPQKYQNYGPGINYMTLVHPGKIGGFDPVEGSEPLDLHTDAVEVGAFEKASEIYFLESGTVKRFTTSD